MSGMSKPKEHHQTLRILVGNWVGQEKLAASPVGAAERATGRINARLDFTIENSPDGGNTWATFMEANYRRA
jgi:hypothetical protein